jgi:hypothetical protein
MTYGLEVKNSSGRTIVDSAQASSYLYASTHGTSASASAFPTTGWSGTDLVIARPPSTSYNDKSVGKYAWGNVWSYAPHAAANVVWRELKSQASSSLSPSGYGLVVYDGTGTASTDILFSAVDLSTTAELVASGKFTGTSGSGGEDGYYTEFTMDSSLDKGRYYVLVTNTQSEWHPGFGGLAYDSYLDYKFDYTNGKIKIQNYLIYNPGTSQVVSTALSRNWDWAIFYVHNGGSVDDNFV